MAKQFARFILQLRMHFQIFRPWFSKIKTCWFYKIDFENTRSSLDGIWVSASLSIIFIPISPHSHWYATHFMESYEWYDVGSTCVSNFLSENTRFLQFLSPYLNCGIYVFFYFVASPVNLQSCICKILVSYSMFYW